MHLKKITVLLSAVFISLLVTTSVSAADIAGMWKTIDDETGEPKSYIAVWINEKNGKAYGTIKKLFRKPGEDQDPVCEKCNGSFKDKKIIGMTNLWGLEKDGDEWEGGHILDPKNGKIYKAKVWLEGSDLKVRGYLGPFYRTQTWKRAN